MPLAVVLFVVARVGGGTGAGARSHYGNLFLVLHVGFVLAAFAGLHARGRRSPALYLWEERRLKRRAADILRLRLPPLASLERLTWRTILVSLPLLTLGLAAGIVRLRERRRLGRRARGGRRSLTWLVYGGVRRSRARPAAAPPTSRSAGSCS